MRLGLGPHLLDDLAALAEQAAHVLARHDEARGDLAAVAGVLAPGPVLAVLVAVVGLRVEDPAVHQEQRLLRGREGLRRAAAAVRVAVGRLDGPDGVPGEGRVDGDDRAGVVLRVGDEAGGEAVDLGLRADDAEGGGRGGAAARRRGGGRRGRRRRCEGGRRGVRGQEAAAAVGTAAATGGAAAVVVVGVWVGAAAGAAAVEAWLGAWRRRRRRVLVVVVVAALGAGAVHWWIRSGAFRSFFVVRFPDSNPVRRIDAVRNWN